MHVLVTGATGFIGLHTVLTLLQAGHVDAKWAANIGSKAP